ncbi:hypothetical protein D515_03385 [Grimontia indica]|uniref:Uncharacterized protein n=1 Tax=Grimontia indica TaxID=1056512 RepID=R1GP01_9GAMM|nr:hypothetical protein [Grimontia indica]EOD77908.1 hypothetical protein D515_03385 [Grimontia indica]
MRESILYWMAEFIANDDNPPYQLSQVEYCGELLNTFAGNVMLSGKKADRSWVDVQVKALVLALNDLNKQCGECLIETDQREGICELIFYVVAQAGHSVEEDITENWREW